MKNILSILFSSSNQFFQLAKESKRITHISISSFLLPILFLVIAGSIFQFILFPIIITNPKETASWFKQSFSLFVMFGMLIIIIFLWVKFFEGRSITTLGFTKKDAAKNYFLGFAYGMLMNSVVVGIMAILGAIEVTNLNYNIEIETFSIVSIFLFGFVVQGAAEETLTRGWMFQVIGFRNKPWIGFIISSIFFTLIHLGNTGINFISTLNLILVSILLSLFVINYKNLWFACAWHSSWNWIMGNVYGLSVSGSGKKVSIFSLNTTGDNLISGAQFGPEGSLITTIVLIIAIFISVVNFIKKYYRIEHTNYNFNKII